MHSHALISSATTSIITAPSRRMMMRRTRSSRSCGSVWPRCRRLRSGPGRGRQAPPCARACRPGWLSGTTASSVPSWRSVPAGWRPTGRPASRRGRRRPRRRCALPSGTALPSWLPACQEIHSSSSGHPQLIATVVQRRSRRSFLGLGECAAELLELSLCASCNQWPSPLVQGASCTGSAAT